MTGIQTATGITNPEKKVLQSTTGITKSDNYYKEDVTPVYIWKGKTLC